MSTDKMKIEFNGTGDGVTDKGTHFISPIGSDFTLCGITLDGDLKTSGGFSVTEKKINCINCISIIRFCKSVRI